MKKQYKILFSDNHRWSQFHFRGCVMKDLLEKGNEVHAVAPASDYIKNDNTVVGVYVHNIRLNRTDMQLKSVLRYICDFLHLVNQIKPDIIFAYTILPIFATFFISFLPRRSRKIAVFAGISSVFVRANWKGTAARLLLKIIIAPFHLIFVLNQEDYNFFIIHHLISSKKIMLLPGGEGVDLDSYIPQHQTHSSIRFLMIARLLKTKGYAEFVLAAKTIKGKYPNVEFILCGELDYNHPEAISKETLDYDIIHSEIDYRGRILNVPEMMNQCDCFVLPSYYNEGMNRSLMEALAVGLPIITTSNKGCGEMVIENYNGFLCKEKDAVSLASAMEKFLLLQDIEKTCMGKNSRILCKTKFDVKNVIKQYEKVFPDFEAEQT